MKADPYGNTQSCAGRSLLEILWQELDNLMDCLYSETDPSIDGLCDQLEDIEADIDELAEAIADDWQMYGERRGEARGTAYAIAVITNPYAPNIEAVRKVAQQRAEKRRAE